PTPATLHPPTPPRTRTTPPLPLPICPPTGRPHPQPRNRQRTLRPGEGATGLLPLGRGRRGEVRTAGRRDRRPPRRPLPRHGSGRPPCVPRHPQRGPRSRGGRHGEPPQGARAGAATTSVRPGRTPGGRGLDRPRDPGSPDEGTRRR